MPRAWVPPLGDLAGFSLRVDDVLFTGLLLDSVVRLALVPQSQTAKCLLIRIVLPIGVFFTYVGMTLFTVARWYPPELGMALASFMRLLVTSLFLIIGFTTFTTEDRLRQFVWFLAFLGVLSVVMGAYQFLVHDDIVLERRTSSFLGPNQLGLASGLLVVLGVVQWRRVIFGSRIAQYLLAGFGLVGIFCAKSMSATLATVVTVGLYQAVGSRRDMLSGFRLVVGIAAATSILALLLFVLRPGDAGALLALQGGSFFHRLIMAQAGLEIFKENPVWGVGWRMSSLPEVVGTTEIGMILRSKYRGLAEYMFPDVTATSVHNMYLQWLAELGLVGTLLFAGVVCYVGFAVRANLRAAAGQSTLVGYGEYFTLGLVLLLVWWNTVPLYGGQLETFLCFVFLGAVAALPNIASGPRSPLG